MDLQNFEHYAGSGNPLVGAQVRVYVASDTTPNPNVQVAATTTDANGKWSFTGLTDGQVYDVKVELPGTLKTKWYRGNAKIGLLLVDEFNPFCILSNTGIQTIATSTITALTFWDSEELDPFGLHSTVTNPSRITITKAGRYYVAAGVQFANNAVGERQVRLHKNGAVFWVNGLNAVSGNVTRAFVSGLIDLAVNDYLEAAVFQNSGGNLDMAVAGNSRFAAVRLP